MVDYYYFNYNTLNTLILHHYFIKIMKILHLKSYYNTNIYILYNITSIIQQLIIIHYTIIIYYNYYALINML